MKTKVLDIYEEHRLGSLKEAYLFMGWQKNEGNQPMYSICSDDYDLTHIKDNLLVYFYLYEMIGGKKLFDTSHGMFIGSKNYHKKYPYICRQLNILIPKE